MELPLSDERPWNQAKTNKSLLGLLCFIDLCTSPTSCDAVHLFLLEPSQAL